MSNLVLILFFLFSIIKLCDFSLIITINITRNDQFYNLPRFWTNTGFCPMGQVNKNEISSVLLSDDVKMNLNLIGALPNQGIKNIRIHWLLELIELKKIKNSTNKFLYDFTNLDKFIRRVDKAGLTIGFEMMGIEVVNHEKISWKIFWKNLMQQIVKRYVDFYGLNKILQWKFETWNEPDLKTYNRLNFTVSDYIDYINSLRQGLNAASRKIMNGIKIKLHGPAGLFKKRKSHPLCWSILEICNKNKTCPLDILTFHRKGNGTSDEVINGTRELFSEIFFNYPNVAKMKISNDEADPISGWSTPRLFQSNVQYAVILTLIILKHWNAMINFKEFKNFQSISHDNAFLSYHPYEFDQRTLLARFQMNLTNPRYSQFIQKPAYSVLGMLGNLGRYAQDIKYFDKENITTLSTGNFLNTSIYIADIFVKNDNRKINLTIKINLSELHLKIKLLSYIIEIIENNTTDPVKIWNFYKKPSYPNATIREEMRKVQGPKILNIGNIKDLNLKQDFMIEKSLHGPFIILFRMCSLEVSSLPVKPFNLQLKFITNGEVLIIWKEVYNFQRCIKTYEVFFSKYSKNKWKCISKNWHIPFLSFHFQPNDGIILGSYKVRSVDIFGRKSKFSTPKKMKL